MHLLDTSRGDRASSLKLESPELHATCQSCSNLPSGVNGGQVEGKHHPSTVLAIPVRAACTHFMNARLASGGHKRK